MMDEKYKDIIDKPYEKSDRHPQMSAQNRAAQFAPFAALSGFEEEIERAQKDHTSAELSKERG